MADKLKPIFRNEACNTPRLFGRLKDHKIPNKMRPIVNKRDGPTYQLEKYMKEIYKDLLSESKYAINSTDGFIKKLREMEIREGEKMVSFDVKDLYPSIDTEEIMEEINKKIEMISRDGKDNDK